MVTAFSACAANNLTDCVMFLPDLIFKNQAMSSRDKDKGSGHFVNDLLRTEFHKYVTVTAILFVTDPFLQKVHGEIYQGTLLLRVHRN